MNLNYQYSITDIDDCVDVSMKNATNGSLTPEQRAGTELIPGANEMYRKITTVDGSGRSSTHYEKYRNGTVLGDAEDLYRLSYAYSNRGFKGAGDADISYGDSKESMLASYSSHAVSEMLEKSTVSFNAMDYTRLKWQTRENPNVATTSRFETSIYARPLTRHTRGLRIQHSSEQPDWIYVPQFTLNTFDLGIFRADCSTMEKATDTINRLDKALKAVSFRRSTYGAVQNRLEHTYRNRDNVRENTTAAESRIRDTDMAKEVVNNARSSILEQAGQSILAQANQSTNGIMSLLR